MSCNRKPRRIRAELEIVATLPHGQSPWIDPIPVCFDRTRTNWKELRSIAIAQLMAEGYDRVSRVHVRLNVGSQCLFNGCVI